MSHTVSIDRINPGLVVILIDQSASMSDAFTTGEFGRSKAEGVADAVNNLLTNLLVRCTKDDGVRDYFDVALEGYGKGGCRSLLRAGDAEPVARPLSHVADTPLRVDVRPRRVEDGVGGIVVEEVSLPVWVEPRSEGTTPMCEALSRAHQLIAQWAAAHPSSFPPVCIHITDGEATDGDPAPTMRSIREISTVDGAALLFNVHLSANGQARPVAFPCDAESLPDDYARMLFHGSSMLPASMAEMAQERGYRLGANARGFALNADLVTLIDALNIGTPAV